MRGLKLNYVTASLALVFVLLVFGITLWLVDVDKEGHQPDNSKAEKAGDNPLVLISFDGFRYDYVTRGLSPNLQSFINNGVTVPYMKASYPTITFPNHYTIVTGLYPESHGIIANSFSDESFDDNFYLGSQQQLDGKWWGGNPIWNTVVQQGKKSATMFWPGSDADIEGIRPTYWFLYNGSTTFEDRVDQILFWLALPEAERPVFISGYFDEPDHTAHDFGPDSQNVNDSLVIVDAVLKRLLDGIEDLNMTDSVNVIILADHGIASAGESRVVNMEDYLPNLQDQAYIYYGAFSRLRIDEEDMGLKSEMKQNTSCKESYLRQYDPPELPKRFHFNNNPNRIEDIIFDLNPGYAVNFESTFSLEGQHGYDNYFTVMQPIFAARGPDFKSGEIVDPFQNIELYNLMCYLVGVIPSTNNGTDASINYLLESPPTYPNLTVDPLPSSETFPDDTTLLQRLDTSGCSGDLTQVENWLYTLNLTNAEVTSALAVHLPWGLQYQPAIPFFNNIPANVLGGDLTLLVHDDHVTGYSPSMKQALWSSFTMGSLPPGTSETDWSSEPRLDASESITCAEYNNLINQSISMNPLFPQRFSLDATLDRIPYLISNAVPMTDTLVSRSNELIALVEIWVPISNSPVNLVVGVIYDNKADSYPDESGFYGTLPTIPSDLFMVITRCDDTVADLSLCSPQSLDAMAFIYQQNQEIPNCLTNEFYAREFSARIRDVEIATNLEFYPTLNFEDKIKLTTKIHSQIWPLA